MGRYHVGDRNTEIFYLEWRGETEFAIKFTDGIATIWCPRAVIVSMEKVKGTDYEVELPIWFAKKMEMI